MPHLEAFEQAHVNSLGDSRRAGIQVVAAKRGLYLNGPGLISLLRYQLH